ncbi:hypothetical protein BGX28_005711 [Mortierella sp. GBA30]|nr:hypothetical protein BGX28_005711 [Mortierella sp. GBA30]
MDVLMAGSDLPVGQVAKTAGIPKSGLSGILYDMGYACPPGLDLNTTLPTPSLYGLPKIALIRRGGATEETACTFRAKLLAAEADGAVAAVIYNGPGQSAIDGATAAINASDTPVAIPGLILSNDDGTMLKTFLRQANNTASPERFNRVRVHLSSDQRMPVLYYTVGYTL